MSYTRAMAEFAWKAREYREPEGSGNPPGESPEEENLSYLLRWVKRPDGEYEQVELPLTPQRFLNPRVTDTILQSIFHGDAVSELRDLLYRYFLAEEDAVVFRESKLLLGRGLPGPAPDVTVIRGLPSFDRKEKSYRVARWGVPPCLVVEVISPDDARIRRVDEVDKVEVYARAGIREYLLVDPPRKANGERFRLRLYRLGPHGRYDAVEPGEDGRFRSETTGLSFAVSPEGGRIEIFDPPGNRLLSAEEEAEGHKAERLARQTAERRAKAAERKARAEQEARQAAEAELARLRAEIERSKKPAD